LLLKGLFEVAEFDFDLRILKFKLKKDNLIIVKLGFRKFLISLSLNVA